MKNIYFTNILMFFIGTLIKINVDFIGVISSAEVLMFFFVFSTFISSFYLAFKKDFKALFFIFLWVIGVIISDFLNSTEIVKFQKGIAMPIFILISYIFFIRIFTKNLKSIIYLFLGYIISAFLEYFFFPEKYSELFHFIFYPILISFIFLLSLFLWPKHKIYVYLYLLIISILSILNGFKSGAGFSLTTILVLNFSDNFKYSRSILFRKGFYYFLFFILITFSITTLYQELAKNGFLGEKQQGKIEFLSRRENLPFFFQNRIELFSSFSAISDSPFFGHGSRPVNPKYTLLMYDLTGEPVGEWEYYLAYENVIPAHSLLLGNWVEYGLLGLSFILFFLFRLIGNIFYFMKNNKLVLTPIIIIISLEYLWHIFFSPFGVEKRIFLSLLLSLYVSRKNIVNGV